jgi:prolipoprotein diacylglyceryltransferase
MVCGLYLILSGIGRFVEEAYRGEPQTPIFWRLRVYQWIAIVTVFLGAAITTLVETPRTPEPIMHLSSLLVALICGIAAWFVSGIDFPESNRRFARLG